MLRLPPARTVVGALLAPLLLAACADDLATTIPGSPGFPLPGPVGSSAPSRPAPARVPVVIAGGAAGRPSATPAGGPIVSTPGLPPAASPGGAPARPGGAPAGASGPGGGASAGGSSGGGSAGGGSAGVGAAGGGTSAPVGATAVPGGAAAVPSGTAPPGPGLPGSPDADVAGLPTPDPGPLTIISVAATGANPGYEAARAVDGDPATEWGAQGAPALTVTFNRLAAVSAVALKTGPTPAGASYVIETSVDGATWSIATTATNAGWGAEEKRLAGAPEARWLRVRYQPGTTTATFMIFELAVDAAPADGLAGLDGPTIVVEPDRVLHAATSHVLGTNRNHAKGDFPNGAAKLAKLRELRPTWAERKYLYRIGHGPTDGRLDYAYMTGYHFERSWDVQSPYPYDDLRHALAEAETLGADQMHVVNYGTGTPEEAGRYVSFLNKADDANRAAHPVARQDVRLFEIGNEIPWSMVRGHAEHAPTETAYAARARKFAQAMRAGSDVPIQIGAVASINSNWEGNGWAGGAATVKAILQGMGDQVDFLIYHGYPSWPLQKAGDLWTVMAQNEWNRQKLEREIKPAIRQYAGGRDVWIANTEFFTHLYNDPTRSRGLFGALYAADTVALAMNQDIRTAVEFCFDHDELADAAFFFGDDPARTTAIYAFQAMLAAHWGDRIVASRGVGIPTQRVVGTSTSLDVPKLAVAAATGGGKVWVLVVNRAPDADVTARVDVGFTPSAARGWVLTDPAGWDAADADVAAIAAPDLAAHAFPRASVTILELTR